MRLIYVDDAGLSNPHHEPFTVVAGFILHADSLWKTLERELASIIERHIPPEIRPGFVLHATELFSGGKTLTRDQWPRERRWAILDELVALPARYQLPVVFACVDRAHYGERSSGKNPSKQDLMIGGHAAAFFAAASFCERWLRKNAPEEIAVIVAENNDQSRGLIQYAHGFARDQKLAEEWGFAVPGHFPLTRIIDTPHFASKTQVSLLQLADACAFSIKKRLVGARDSERFFLPLADHLISSRKEGVPPIRTSSPAAQA
jgi:hypothetical protein